MSISRYIVVAVAKCSCALEAMDGFHHVLEHGVEKLARLLGITVGEQLHGALEVGEEDGHLFAFAFERPWR